MRRINSLVVVLTALVCGCGEREQTRTIELAHMDPGQAMMLVEPYLTSAGKLRATEHPAALTITAPPEKVEQIAVMLARYDVPPPTVRLHFQIIEGNGFTTADSAIAGVENALRDVLRFRGYRLIAEALVHSSAGSSPEQQIAGPNGILFYLTVGIQQITASEGRKAAVLEVRLSTATSGGPILSSALTVPDGQTVVIGTARPLPNMGALILVVRPEIQ